MPNPEFNQHRQAEGARTAQAAAAALPGAVPCDRGALKPWAVGEGYLYRLEYHDFWLTSGDYILVSAQIK